MSMKRFDFAIARRQRGAVLFVAMIFLILITLMAVTASWNSVLQERMTGGMRNRQLGMLGAESALRFGEAYVWNAVDRANIADGCLPLRCDANGGQGGCYTSTGTGELPAAVQAFRTATPWVATAGLPYGGQLLAANLTDQYKTAALAAQPRYIIEEMTTVTRNSAVTGANGSGGGDGNWTQLGADNDRGRHGGGSGGGGGGSGGIGTRTLYRITARSLGGSDAVLRIAESTFEAKKITGCNPN